MLHVRARSLVRAVRPLAARAWFPAAPRGLSLAAPGNQTRVILLAVGLGSFFVLGVRALQANLLESSPCSSERGGADMFLIDIQHDQVDGVRGFSRERKGAEPQLIPVLRARVTGVRGSETTSRATPTCAAAAASAAST